MAFNWQTFKTRTLSAIIFAVVMLAGLLWNEWSLLVLFSIIHFGCWWEFFGLVEKIHKTRFHPYVKLGFMLLSYGLLLRFCGPGYQVSGYSLSDNISLPVSAAGFALLIIGIFQRMAIKAKAFGLAALGLIYLGLSCALIIDLNQPRDFHVYDTVYVVNGLYIVLFMIASIWINDTMAYIVGSVIGKTPLSSISPKKTWEGTIGGIILSIIVTGGLAYFAFNQGYLSIHVMIVAGIAAITGTIGDLLESKLKRSAGVKDSGHLMPGHGGFLDRFDSLLVASFFVWLYVTLIGS